MADHSEERLDLLTLALRRRDFIKGGLGMAALGFLGHSAPAASQLATPPLLGFKPLPMVTTPHFDTVRVAEGYSAKPFFSWGDAVMHNAPAWLPDASQDWQAQALQAGQGHDGMWYFPFPDQPDHHGLLVVNHEHLQTEFLHPSGPAQHTDDKGRIRRPLPEVHKEQMAHGLSIIEIRRDTRGQWQRSLPSRFNRRITAQTPMQASGPAAGSTLLKTAADPDGRTVHGTLNNCAMGVTPWGTYLTCEENFHKYFVNRNSDDYRQRSSHSRYEILQGDNDDMYQWGSADLRFDATPADDQPHQGFVNEPHRFGWVVEIDPFDPASIPVKRTALGRFCHEGATVTLATDGRVVVYSGDDSKGEYIYRFVSREKYVPGSKHKHSLLDDGTLFVARFHDDGRGEWLPLVQGQGPLTAANGFATQADVLVNARLAADKLLATPMDRPEWITVHPHTGEVYVTLTNNDKRGTDFPLNAANPRRENLHGHIVRWQPAGNNHAADSFRWEIFLLAGIRNERQDLFSSPDGLWIDANHRLWIATDFDDNETAMKDMGYNQLLCADPVTRETRRFLIGPKGCEITGITMTPDCRTLWVNVQDPSISYPASDGKTRPRSTTVVITKNDGGVIGT